MSEAKWRILTDGQGAATAPLSAQDIASRLWAMEGDLLWAEPLDGGEGAYPQEIPEVRRLIAADGERVADAWLQYRPRPDWLFLWVSHVCATSADEGWSIVMALVAAARDDKALAEVAAGPLEELLRAQGGAVVERVVQRAQRDGRFRRALGGVWRSSIPETVWNRVQKAIGSEPMDGRVAGRRTSG